MPPLGVHLAVIAGKFAHRTRAIAQTPTGESAQTPNRLADCRRDRRSFIPQKRCGKSQHEPVVFGLRQCTPGRKLRLDLGRLALFAQDRQVGVAGKGFFQRRQCFVEKHVPVAGVPEIARQGLPARHINRNELGRQRRGEKPERGTQAANGDTRLMHELGIVPGNGTGFVALQVQHAGERYRAEGLERRHCLVQRRGRRLHRPQECRIGERVAAFRLADDLRMQIDVLAQTDCEVKQRIGRLALDKLKFEFANRRRNAPGVAVRIDGVQFPAIERNLDHRAAMRNNPGGAREIRREHGLQPGMTGFKQFPQRLVTDDAEIEHAGLRRRFPFAALGQPAGTRSAALDRHQPGRPALAPQAQRNPAIAQIELRRVVISVEQPVPLRLVSGQEWMRRHPPCMTRRQPQFEFDFLRHRLSLRTSSSPTSPLPVAPLLSLAEKTADCHALASATDIDPPTRADSEASRQQDRQRITRFGHVMNPQDACAVLGRDHRRSDARSEALINRTTSDHAEHRLSRHPGQQR